jgi:hypothetical protein
LDHISNMLGGTYVDRMWIIRSIFVEYLEHMWTYLERGWNVVEASLEHIWAMFGLCVDHVWTVFEPGWYRVWTMLGPCSGHSLDYVLSYVHWYIGQ